MAKSIFLKVPLWTSLKQAINPTPTDNGDYLSTVFKRFVMKKSFFASVLILILAFFAIAASAADNKPTINLIYKHTGFGLARDAEILTKELKSLGYSVRSYRANSAKSLRQADINLFLEDVNKDFFSSAKKNYLIPNPEWYCTEVSLIPEFDMILCKTLEAKRIFQQHHPNAVFMGFTSIDRYNAKVNKNFRQALHMAGRNHQKGTDSLVKAWELNPQLPGLTMYRYQGRCDFPPLYNVQLFCCFVPDAELVKIQNSHGLHLCPSETEGFGQYMMEAFSCGAIPITTNAPPMNEFVTDQRCLASYTHTAEQRLATNYYVDPVHLGQVVANLMLLSDEELAEMGKKNRQFYLDSKRQFQEKFRKIFAPDQDRVVSLTPPKNRRKR